EDDDYEIKAFSYLESAIKKKKKKLLLLIDNIDELIGKLSEKEQRRLREILLSSSSFRIVGGSTKMLEQHYDYGKPFYEFFKIIKLTGFTKEESIDFLRSIGKGEQKERMEEIIKTNPARIETLRQLTGGVPRTLVMLFDIFLDEGGNAFDDLLKVLDEATPLYKHRIDELPPQLQELVHTIAINWDGMYTAEIAKKTRISTKIISAQLGKLEKYDIIESESAGKNKLYKIKERFFNIWYLMRFGRKKDRQRVEWLVKFLVSWCTQEELDERAKKLIDKIQEGNMGESYVFHMAEALGYAGISENIGHALTEKAREYLLERDSKLGYELSKSDKDFIEKIEEIMYKGKGNNINKVLEYVNKNKKDSSLVLLWIALMYLAVYDLEKAKEYTLKSLNKGNKRAESLLAYIYFLLGESREDALTLSKRGYGADNASNTKIVYASVLLWNEDFTQSHQIFLNWLNDNIMADLYLESYFLLLLAKEQYYQVKNILEDKQFNLKEKYKPIWYA
ncbi:MAG: winged helix-turn-helix transcriptional regulator, partial [Bacteroidales bacterium]|nr:winged helix-turn-helix transcriptional regulator [Bacteroidales bacterium]